MIVLLETVLLLVIAAAGFAIWKFAGKKDAAGEGEVMVDMVQYGQEVHLSMCQKVLLWISLCSLISESILNVWVSLNVR